MDVSPKGEEGYYVNATLYNLRPNERPKKLKYPMILSPSNKIEYFEREQPFTLMSIASSPMFVMIGMSALMYFCVQNMPKPGNQFICIFVDKEAMKEANEQMKNMKL